MVKHPTNLPEGDDKMLIGEFSHSLDVKGRVFIPAKLRVSLGESFIATKGLDNCIAVYSSNEWENINERIKALPVSKSRNLQRFLFSGAAEIEPDKQGRVLLPANLREYASLDKDVVIIGASTHVEIWDKAKWDATCGDLTSDSVAEAMDELGF